MSNWKIFKGSLEPHEGIRDLPEPPPWRHFRTGAVTKERKLEGVNGVSEKLRGGTFQTTSAMVEMVNAALYLRRPLLITGNPGTGKSSLIHAVAYELKLGEVLVWPVTSRSTLQSALYNYDAIGRVQDRQLAGQTPNITDYLRLGPLGTALLPTNRPRALLIDGIDRAEIDLPNDLLNILEEGRFDIAELERHKEPEVQVRAWNSEETFPVVRGRLDCKEFPFVVLTSNGEREFPPAFLRRCLRLTMPNPDMDTLVRIVEAHLGKERAAAATRLIEKFLDHSQMSTLATDQLLNAVLLVTGEHRIPEEESTQLIDALFKELTG